MTRLYIQPSWVDAASDHGEWSGGNGQYRGDRSVEVVPTYINGKPNVKAFSDEAIEARRSKKTKVPLKSRILPQLTHLERIQSEILELEQGYKAGEYDIEEYSLLRNVLFTKYDRAQVLYKKAISVSRNDVCEQYPEDTPHPSSKTHEYGGEIPSQIFDSCDRVVHQGCKENEEISCSFIDELSEQNFFKNPLKKACRWTRKAIEFSHKAKAYYMTLKEV